MRLMIDCPNSTGKLPQKINRQDQCDISTSLQ
jgi:hypothetical protein